MPIAVGETFERYEIESLIGRGGMGEVYRAVDTRLRRKVALKVLRPDRDNEDAVARLFREARAAAVLAHPNTVAIHDIGESEGIFYIVMELVAGSSMLAFVGNDRIPHARKLGWLLDVARAISAAHKAGIIHRDVKPSNVMVSEDDIVKVLDFGLARPIEPVSFRTQKGHVLGTPRYMAPEALAGADVSAQSDQYAFGITGYELLAGKHPGGAIAGVEPTPPLDKVVSALSRHVAAVFERTMATLPEDRFPSMDDVATALEDAIAGRPQRSPAVAGPPPAREPSEVTALEAGIPNAPLDRTMPLGSPSRASTPAVTTQRAGGGDAAVVVRDEAVAQAVAAPPTDLEEDVPTATARTTANIAATLIGPGPLPAERPPDELKNVLAAPHGMTGPNGTLLDPKAIAYASAPPPPVGDRSKTLLSRDVPTPMAQAAATLASPEHLRTEEIVAAEALAKAAKAEAEADARAEAKAKADADARAKAKAKARAEADARMKASAAMDPKATTGTDAKAKAKLRARAEDDARTKAEAAKKTRTMIVVALVVLGGCAFAGAYFGSKGFSRPQLPATPETSSAASTPAMTSAAPSSTTSIVPLLPLEKGRDDEAASAAASASVGTSPPSVRPARRTRPPTAPSSSPLDMKLR
jgi:serine/threonine-protein kinase